MNENISNMLLELKNNYPDIYGLTENFWIEVIDNDGNYDSDDDFNEANLWRVRICYQDKLFTITRQHIYLFEISDDNYLDLRDLDEIGKIINIIGKHLKKISYNLVGLD